jgi:hypothetical protein
MVSLLVNFIVLVIGLKVGWSSCKWAYAEEIETGNSDLEHQRLLGSPRGD